MHVSEKVCHIPGILIHYQFSTKGQLSCFPYINYIWNLQAETLTDSRKVSELSQAILIKKNTYKHTTISQKLSKCLKSLFFIWKVMLLK